jgi:hypothetical protein
MDYRSEKQFEWQLLMKQETICYVHFINHFNIRFVTVYANRSLMWFSLDLEHIHPSSKHQTFGTIVKLSHTILWLYIMNLQFRIYFTKHSNNK